MMRYDLIVVGGGFAGVASAIASARQGAKVLLVEKSNCLGGASVNSLVNPFMDFRTKIQGEEIALNQGIFKEIHKGLEQRGAIEYNGFNEEELKILLNHMVEEAGVDLLFHAHLIRSVRIGSRISSITVATVSGEIELEADYYIDATGNAQLTYLSSFPTVQGRKEDGLCQPMTLCFRVGNVDTDAFYKSLDRVQEEYKKAQLSGEITNPRENILVFSMPAKNVLHFNTTRVVKLSPTSPFDLTRAEILARKQVSELYSFLKERADGMEESFLMMTGSEIGVRESRRIIGEHTLTQEECKKCTKFEDAVVACNYDIDIHNPSGAGTSHYYFKDGEYYTIPYRCLIPKGAENLLVAGRCISSDHEAQASYRIMPTVCCIGEAAGVAIGLAVKSKKSVSQIDIQRLKEIIKEGYCQRK